MILEGHLCTLQLSMNPRKQSGMLLELGADPNKTPKGGLSPLHCAMKGGSRCQDYIRDLLNHGAGSTAVHTETGCTCWHMAAELDNKIALEVLIAKGEQKATYLVTPENDGFLPLFYATKHKSKDAVEVLLSQTSEGSDILQRALGGVGLVHRVVEMNSIKLLRLLRSKGVPLTRKLMADIRHFMSYCTVLT